MRIAAGVAAVVACGVGLWGAEAKIPELAAGGLLRPTRHAQLHGTPAGCSEREWRDAGVTLRGWVCQARAGRKGTVVYLHGIADNRGSSLGVIRRYTARGFDVIAYDSRAHGTSDGKACTYGYHEKHDLRRVIGGVRQGPVVLVGTSLGAAVAIQTAVLEPRVSAIVAAEVFADLDTVARERAPFFLTARMIAKAFERAESAGSFRVRDVSPVAAAIRLRIPVLLVHGSADVETTPSHSIRVYDALTGPKRLILVQGAGHNRSLSDPDVWRAIDDWITR